MPSSTSSTRNADLHCHSTVSDGTLRPEALARRAHANGVALWALTAHDEVGGLIEAADTASSLGMAFVPGVEISVSVGDQTIHVVGLDIDATNAELRAGLAQVRQGRDARARAMAIELERHAGAKDIYACALRQAGNPALLSRTHFARCLVEQGLCANTHDVFTRYLTPGKPGYVEHDWASLADAVGWIRGAGGLAVIAHPGRYRFTSTEEWALFARFRELGGVGVEVVTASHSATDFRKYATIAREFGFHASRGSDFHSPGESRCDLGKLPLLPEGTLPIWNLLH